MDGFQLAILAMALTDTDWEPRDAHGRRRQLTADELDALAEFDWPWAGMKGRLAACANAVRSFWRPRASSPIDPMPLPAAEATAQV